MILDRKAAMERDDEETAKDLKKKIRKAVKLDKENGRMSSRNRN